MKSVLEYVKCGVVAFGRVVRGVVLFAVQCVAICVLAFASVFLFGVAVAFAVHVAAHGYEYGGVVLSSLFS